MDQQVFDDHWVYTKNGRKVCVVVVGARKTYVAGRKIDEDRERDREAEKKDRKETQSTRMMTLAWRKHTKPNLCFTVCKSPPSYSPLEFYVQMAGTEEDFLELLGGEVFIDMDRLVVNVKEEKRRKGRDMCVGVDHFTVT